ncbi:MAG TPA: fumarylacetoacetate hydrolase family protein [Solirubrobacteraceae bacterium]|nr:fumarylacetoacetate hydrolase family protein [Solirubrobacteraceae bacterium]
MRFASVSHAGSPLLVRIEGDAATPLAGATELGRETSSAWLAAAEPAGDPLPLGELHLRPLVPRPSKVICVGLNYVAHIEETKRQTSDYPVLFPKFASSLAGARDPLPLPPESEAVDFEGELAVVIGTAARRVERARALAHVAGLAVANDVTMRDYQYKTHQWMQGKAWDAVTPLGPEFVTLDEIGDGGGLTLRTTLNGEVVQETSTDLMIFDIPTLVSTISVFTTLEPGDVILTGTPSGVGFRRDPPLLLRDGDVLVTEVDGLGRLENRMVAEA